MAPFLFPHRTGHHHDVFHAPLLVTGEGPKNGRLMDSLDLSFGGFYTPFRDIFQAFNADQRQRIALAHQHLVDKQQLKGDRKSVV